MLLVGRCLLDKVPDISGEPLIPPLATQENYAKNQEHDANSNGRFMTVRKHGRKHHQYE